MAETENELIAREESILAGAEEERAGEPQPRLFDLVNVALAIGLDNDAMRGMLALVERWKQEGAIP